jgi:hypothetical protein
MYAYLRMSAIYRIKSECEVESGYVDIALLRNEPMKPDFYAVFEIKYVKRSDYEKAGEALVQKKINEATTQIEKYADAPELKELLRLKRWVLVFAGAQCVANVEV